MKTISQTTSQKRNDFLHFDWSLNTFQNAWVGNATPLLSIQAIFKPVSQFIYISFEINSL